MTEIARTPCLNCGKEFASPRGVIQHSRHPGRCKPTQYAPASRPEPEPVPDWILARMSVGQPPASQPTGQPTGQPATASPTGQPATVGQPTGQPPVGQPATVGQPAPANQPAKQPAKLPKQPAVPQPGRSVRLSAEVEKMEFVPTRCIACDSMFKGIPGLRSHLGRAPECKAVVVRAAIAADAETASQTAAAVSPSWRDGSNRAAAAAIESASGRARELHAAAALAAAAAVVAAGEAELASMRARQASAELVILISRLTTGMASTEL